MADATPRAGDLLGEWLASQKKPAAWLAREAELSQAHMSLVLRGKKGLSPEAAGRIASLTQIDARLLLEIGVPSEAA